MIQRSLAPHLAALLCLLAAACGPLSFPSAQISTPSQTPTVAPSPTPEPTRTPVPIRAAIEPSLEQAFREGFGLLAGFPPFSVDFSASVQGGEGALSYAWDFDGDGLADSDRLDPDAFVYTEPGEYAATLTLRDQVGQEVVEGERVVVIGEPKLPAWRFGVTAHLNEGFGLYASDAEVEQGASMLADLGVDAVRLDLAWAEVQPDSPESFNWDDYDHLVSMSRVYGYDLLPILAYNVPWARANLDAENWEDWYFAPPPVLEYARFVYEAVHRYQGDVRAWQIWNEPNLSVFWKPGPDPVQYAELLKQAFLAAKYADPGAVVVMAGLANYGRGSDPQVVGTAPETFLQAVYDSGAGRYFDAAARHPYTSPYEGSAALQSKAARFLAVMADNGDGGKPLWITELGSPSCRGAGVSEGMQAQWIALSFDALLGLDSIGPVLWYNLREKGSDLRDCEDHYGLIANDWTPKPAYNAYQEYIAEHP